jgi:transcriptional regulator with XRE-family HTH domain
MASLGQELKRERELRGISLREIADSTRISLRFLQALEEDRLDVIPGAFFIRAILRSYARSIGIDEHQVLNKYQEIYTFEEQLQYGESPERPMPRRRHRPPLFSRKSVRIAGLTVAVIGLGLVLLYFLLLSPEKKQPVPAKTTQPVAQVEVPKPIPPPEPEPVVEEIKGLRLEMTFIDETWIHVYADGQSVWDGIKNKGESLEVRAEREVRLNIGNAGGSDLTINGQKAKPFGPSGAVRLDILITPENYHDFLDAGQEKTG